MTFPTRHPKTPPIEDLHHHALLPPPQRAPRPETPRIDVTQEDHEVRTFAGITSSDCARVISVNAAHLFGPLAITGPSIWRRTRTPSMSPTMAERASKPAQGLFVSFPTHSTLATVPHPNTPCTDRENSSPDESCQASCASLAGFHWARRGAEFPSEHVTHTHDVRRHVRRRTTRRQRRTTSGKATT